MTYLYLTVSDWIFLGGFAGLVVGAIFGLYFLLWRFG